MANHKIFSENYYYYFFMQRFKKCGYKIIPILTIKILNLSQKKYS